LTIIIINNNKTGKTENINHDCAIQHHFSDAISGHYYISCQFKICCYKVKKVHPSEHKNFVNNICKTNQKLSINAIENGRAGSAAIKHQKRNTKAALADVL
jgi:hypothetical protein